VKSVGLRGECVTPAGSDRHQSALDKHTTALVVVKDTCLYKEPRGDESQTAVLSVEPVVVRVEREVVQVEESVDKREDLQPITANDNNILKQHQKQIETNLKSEVFDSRGMRKPDRSRAGAKLNLVELTQCEITFASAFDLDCAKGMLFSKNMQIR
ncbi:hypothetical protein SFRURICE_010987, partial [Spodoptera frugiperda]